MGYYPGNGEGGVQKERERRGGETRLVECGFGGWGLCRGYKSELVGVVEICGEVRSADYADLTAFSHFLIPLSSTKLVTTRT